MNSPDHYTNEGSSIDVVTWAKSQGLDVEGFYRINALKYLTRAGKKSTETKQEDLIKALDYIYRELTGEWIDKDLIKQKIKQCQKNTNLSQ